MSNRPLLLTAFQFAGTLVGPITNLIRMALANNPLIASVVVGCTIAFRESAFWLIFFPLTAICSMFLVPMLYKDFIPYFDEYRSKYDPVRIGNKIQNDCVPLLMYSTFMLTMWGWLTYIEEVQIPWRHPAPVLLTTFWGVMGLYTIIMLLFTLSHANTLFKKDKNQ